MPGKHHLAQVNIGRLLAPVDNPIMEGFVRQLDPVNALADASPGFVWRLKAEDNNATSYRPYPEDELMAINMSVWESFEALQQFVYRSGHVTPMRDRRKWFQPLDGPILALWWVPAGHVPTIEEAKSRLAMLKERGPCAEVFTFRKPFPPPGSHATEVAPLDARFCEWAT